MSRFICHYAECLYAVCRYAKCRFAECRGACNFQLKFAWAGDRTRALKVTLIYFLAPNLQATAATPYNQLFSTLWAQCYKTFYIRNLRVFVIS